MINYGVVGIGGFGATWVRCLDILEKQGVARLAAAAETNQQGCAQQIATLETEGKPVYDSLEAMLAHECGRIDLIGIAAGIPAHEPLAIQALEAGYNVHVEKPVAAAIQDVERIRQVQARTGRWCSVDYQFLYSPTIQWLGEKLRDGAFGALHEMRSTVGWPRPASYYARNGWAGRLCSGGRWVLDGPATNATSHYLTNMLYLTMAAAGGQDGIATVQAELYRAKPIDSYDTSCIRVTFASGVRVVQYSSHAIFPTIEPIMLILCEGATITWDASANAAEVDYRDGRHDRYADPDVTDNHVRPFAQIARVVAGEEPSPLCGLDEAAPQVRVINLAFESSGGIWPVSASMICEQSAEDGSALIGIAGMEQVLYDAHQSGRLFSELDIPWARATQPIDAEGYVRFPQGPALRQYLLAG